ncbi:MAG: hypothetical protein JKY43_01075 [Phycisphaerales bacterium]|nr:hypothetical protein [Phycisphaerales bacterium]
MPANTPHHAHRQIEIIRDELTLMLTEEPKLAPHIAKAMTALNSLEHTAIFDADSHPSRRQRGPKQAHTVEGYRIERNSDGSVLAEYRSTDAEPFRCPKPIVEATAVELSKLKQSKFIDLFEAIKFAMGERIADYHVRTALRFMKHEGLVLHERARFSPARPGSLRVAVMKVWKKLENEG